MRFSDNYTDSVADFEAADQEETATASLCKCQKKLVFYLCVWIKRSLWFFIVLFCYPGVYNICAPGCVSDQVSLECLEHEASSINISTAKPLAVTGRVAVSGNSHILYM